MAKKPTGNENSGESEQLESENDLSDEEGITYFEESSESEPELDCDIWDDSKVLTDIHILGCITGCHLMATCTHNPDENNLKRIKLCPTLNPNLEDTNFIQSLQKSWLKDTQICSQNVDLITSPFKLCVLKNAVGNPAFLNEIRKAFYEEKFHFRNMDLYEFFQSKDLKYYSSSEPIRMVYEFLQNDVMNWVSTITGYELSHMSCTCSLYTNTDYLLLHDDQREDRRVAFILYLSDEGGWNKQDGGALQLFSKDSEGQPSEAVREVLPADNQLIFFPVTNDSYHQVAEITSLSKYRLSINGWFHTKTPPVFPTPSYRPLENGIYSSVSEKPKPVDIDLSSWIEADYLKLESIETIQKHIEEQSEISLKRFFKKEAFEEIYSSLESSDVKWNKVGPLNRYNYQVMDTKEIPHVMERFLDLFRSTAMFNLLHKYTDLDLTTVKFEIQKWTPGSYALLADYEWENKNELDLMIYFGIEERSDVIGCKTHYVTLEDEVQNALITIEAEKNSLNIVYRDSARFTKYFSKLSRCRCFYTFFCSYSE